MPRPRSSPDSQATTIRVVLVEPQPVLGAGVREVLDRESGIELVAHVRSPDEALSIIDEAAPDVILVDVPFGESSATITARRLRRDTPRSALIVLGGEDDDASIIGAVEIGAMGHVAEFAQPDELVATIRSVAEGEDPIKSELSSRPDLVDRIVDDVRTTILEGEDITNPLTPRELDMLGMAALGLRNREIADRLEVSLQTVKNHLSTALHKLGARNRTRAVMYAVRQGWLVPGEVPHRTRPEPRDASNETSRLTRPAGSRGG
jgi:NarL family two-component system response regulator LiaR